MLKNILFKSLIEDDYDNFVANLFNYSSLINSVNNKNESLLHYSCFYGMIDKYYALINMGAEIQKTNKLNNLLHYASFSGNDDFLIVELIKLGINPIEINNYGQTSLHYASNERICHYLNLWCLRNNIKITSLTDHMGNSIAHSSYALKHFLSTQYWLRNYPALKSVRNQNGLLYNEVNPIKFNFCNL